MQSVTISQSEMTTLVTCLRDDHRPTQMYSVLAGIYPHVAKTVCSELRQQLVVVCM